LKNLYVYPHFLCLALCFDFYFYFGLGFGWGQNRDAAGRARGGSNACRSQGLVKRKNAGAMGSMKRNKFVSPVLKEKEAAGKDKEKDKETADE
jgi:hypothetical protein